MTWDLSGGVAVVTGAASGIGRALARRLSVENMSLALADVNEPGLQETVREIRRSDTRVSTHVVDVSEARRVEQFGAEVIEQHGRVTLLINNAGVALHGNVEEVSVADIEYVMGINFWGMIYGVKNFLPTLRKQPRAHIVNLSSIFGIVSPAGQAAYCASKFAVRGFTESLQHELEGTTVGVSCVHPGGIRTPISRNARAGAGVSQEGRDANVALFEEVLSRTSPEAAADQIVEGVKRGERRILIGGDAVLTDRLQRLLPVRYWGIMRSQLEKARLRMPTSKKI